MPGPGRGLGHHRLPPQLLLWPDRLPLLSPDRLPLLWPDRLPLLWPAEPPRRRQRGAALLLQGGGGTATAATAAGGELWPSSTAALLDMASAPPPPPAFITTPTWGAVAGAAPPENSFDMRLLRGFPALSRCWPGLGSPECSWEDSSCSWMACMNVQLCMYKTRAYGGHARTHIIRTDAFGGYACMHKRSHGFGDVHACI